MMATNRLRRFHLPVRVFPIIVMGVVSMRIAYGASGEQPMLLPFVKQATIGEQSFSVSSVTIDVPKSVLDNETAILREMLAERRITVSSTGTPIRLRLQEVRIPPRDSDYQPQIAGQAYHLVAGKEGIDLESPTPAGILFAIQTLMQLILPDGSVRETEILDWPDLAVRGIMVDLARANENYDFYARLIRFCAHYKINRLHMHLTDDDNASLYHENYPWLMHPHAWRRDNLERLVALAARYHIDVVPEIESLGHARVFLRHPDFRQILHQTTDTKPKASWAGTDVAGYTNVLCPASEKTQQYLGDMFERAAEIFPFPETHIGGDEVDETECARCKKRFPNATYAEWYLAHVKRCVDILGEENRRTGLWGDVLLKHPDIIDRIPRDRVVIYDWHYRPNMTDDSVIFFKEQGFDVLGCPALVCHPHMIMPTDFNYENIRRFGDIARAHDLLGLDTTIWTPIRYMSDVLWPGIAFASSYAWSGSNWNEADFFDAFVSEFFGSTEGAEFAKAWTTLSHLRWWLDRFKVSSWDDEPSLQTASAKAAGEWGETARKYLLQIATVKQTFRKLDTGVTKNRTAWMAILHSTEILEYVLTHFLAATNVRQGETWNKELVSKLDAKCMEALGWIEANWDRNRFADDPYKKDLNSTGQHLLDHFRQMHEFHALILGEP